MVHLYESFEETKKPAESKTKPAQQTQTGPNSSAPADKVEVKMQQQQQQQGLALTSAQMVTLRERFTASSRTENPEKSAFVPVVMQEQQQQRPQHTAVQLRQQQMQSRDL